jgi:hypothetical protein
MMHSTVLIIPAALREPANAVGEAMGWGPNNYSIPLGDGESVTHYGLRADADGQFVRWVRGQDPLPDPSAQPVIDALIADFSPDPDDAEKPQLWGRDHLDAVLAEQGLVIMTEEE